MSPPQSNSESLPDLKWNSPKRSHRRNKDRCSPHIVGHSLSDPALVRALNGLDKTNRCSASPRIEQIQSAELASSLSDCSDQSGWVSSTVSSRHSSPNHARTDEPIYPDLEPVPLAPPEEFQV